MKPRHQSRWTRRDLFKFGIVAGGATLPKKLWTPDDDQRRSRVSFTPFTQQLPIPEVLQGSPVLPPVLDCFPIGGN